MGLKEIPLYVGLYRELDRERGLDRAASFKTLELIRNIEKIIH
jgi:hypothetical protein